MTIDRNYDVITNDGAHPIKAWVRGVQFEDAARKQVENLARMPFIHKHVAVMPDVHKGIGATVGSVIATKGAIIPAAVGVDLGCGIMATRTSLTASQLPDTLAPLRFKIERAIPHGRTDNGGSNDRGSWKNIPTAVRARWITLDGQYAKILKKHPKIGHHRPLEQLCSLGTGNHFVEVCLDEEDHVWVMLHSGSRGPGASVGMYFIEKAKIEMRRWFINLPDVDLAYLPEGSDLFDDYVEAVKWAQEYAVQNREGMLDAALGAMHELLPPFETNEDAVQCHHNYVSWEKHFGEEVIVTRKGAVRARVSDLGIIPGSMGTKSYIVRGRGNPESFESCSHGAGRRMSRTEAKKTFTLEDHEKATAGVECRKDLSVIDETPGAYKDVDSVIAAEADLVEVVHTLRGVLCVKG